MTSYINSLETIPNEHHFLCYNMVCDDHQQFWEFWKTSGKPDVQIGDCDMRFSEFVPSDAVIRVTNYEEASASFLDSLGHVEKLECDGVDDYAIVGYTGHAKIGFIRLTSPLYYDGLPDCDSYLISNFYFVFDNFDCRGKKLFTPSPFCGDSTDLSRYDGLFETIAHYFTNFSTISVSPLLFDKFYEETPELATNPNIIVRTFATDTFNTSILAGKRIEKLELFGLPLSKVKHDPHTELHIGEIVQHSSCFNEFVAMFGKRFYRTKRAQ